MLNLSNKLSPEINMILSCLFFSVLGGIIKYLGSVIHPFEQAFFRNFFSIILLSFFFFVKKIKLKTKRIRFLFLRSIFGAITMILLFWTYTLIPLSQAMAISFSTPLFIFVGSMIFLKEKPNWKKKISIFTGFLFVLTILRPDYDLKLGTIIGLIAALSHAATGLMVKDLTKTESISTIMFYMVIFMSFLTFPTSLIFWSHPPNLNIWLMLILLAITGTLGNYFWTNSISQSKMTNIMVFDFYKLIFATLIGLFFFKEEIDVVTVLAGIGLILNNIFLQKHFR